MIKALLLFAMTVCGYTVCAQSLNLLYTTEWQVSQKGRTNLVNLLRTDASVPLANRISAEIATLHIAKTSEKRIISDWQTFSNIEEDNLPFGLAVAGINIKTGHSAFFIGVRNVNEDYFSDPCTSLFTNSSNGIFPTLSTSLPVPNYPVTAMTLHYAFTNEHIEAQGSLYNGRAYSLRTLREQPFRVRPETDGVFGIFDFMLKESDTGRFHAGTGLHYGHTVDEPEQNAGRLKDKRMRGAWWIHGERRIGGYGEKKVMILTQYSQSFGPDNACKRYAEVGCVVETGPKDNGRAGLSIQHADFKQGAEWSVELTYNRSVSRNANVQPSFQFIKNTEGCFTVFTMRLYLAAERAP